MRIHYSCFWKSEVLKSLRTSGTGTWWRSVLKISWKSWIWDQYRPKNMKWQFCDMEPISFENIKIFSEYPKLGNFETQKPRNQRPRNHQETNKLWNQEANNFLFPSKGIPTCPQGCNAYRRAVRIQMNAECTVVLLDKTESSESRLRVLAGNFDNSCNNDY